MASIIDYDPKAGTTTLDEDWQTVVNALHPETGSYDAIQSFYSRVLYCDGFGDLSQPMDESERQTLAWDWSHVRDSSEAAIRRCASAIRGREFMMTRRAA